METTNKIFNIANPMHKIANDMVCSNLHILELVAANSITISRIVFGIRDATTFKLNP